MAIPQTEIIITVAGTERGRFLFEPGEYILGRNPDCHIPVEADLVSRRHAKLTLNFDHAFIEDLGSSNGTQVNGQPAVGNTRLWPNQKIQIGAATIELRRIKVESTPDMTVTPTGEVMRRVLPEAFLREKKYDIGGVIAQGGMGAILNAREATIERTVAMKVMLNTNSPDDLLRFIGEAKITGQLEHPNIVPVHELNVDENGQVFYTMKMVQGITLRKVLDLLAEGVAATAKKYPLAALLTVYQKVCDALAFAHSKGVIHRDLKPENIMLGDYGEVLLMDWGLAKRIGNDECRMTNDERAGSNSSFDIRHSSFSGTLAGTVMGTPQFMAPEQARGEVETLDARSDIYALGGILYQILSLRIAVTGKDAMEVVGKVGRGEIEPLDCGSSLPLSVPQLAADARHAQQAAPASKRQQAAAVQKGRTPKREIPDGLAAVVRKAMAFDREARYRSVAELQHDIEAYQNGFATSAEQAGAWKQFTLLVKRHKAASIGLAAVLLVSIGLTAKVIAEGRRAERGEAKANAALADLKASAPALLQLAESEADSQRFASALGKLDAALALDPALLRARWQRAWVLLALERWSEAADALRLARQHDPAGAPLASILPAVEQVAAAPEAERWKSDAAREVFAHLQTVEATGPALAFSGKLKLGAAERLKLADQRLLAALGKGNYSISITSEGLIAVILNGRPLRSLEAMRGLPIESLSAEATLISDLEPLRGMRLQVLNVPADIVTDLTPLHGMPLRSLDINGTRVSSLSPLSGMRLSKLNAKATRVSDPTPLTGMPLTELWLNGTKVSRIEALRGMPLVYLELPATVLDCSPLKGAPLQHLGIAGAAISDLNFAKGMPLRYLSVFACPISNIDGLRGLPLEILNLFGTLITDLTPLQGAPLKDLDLRGCKQLTDYTPVLTLPRLERLHCDVLPAALLPLRESPTLQSIEANAYPGEGSQGARPVAEFWRAYDAHQAAQKK